MSMFSAMTFEEMNEEFERIDEAGVYEDKEVRCSECGLRVSPGFDQLAYGFYEVHHRICPALQDCDEEPLVGSAPVVPIREGLSERIDAHPDSVSASSSRGCANLDEQEDRARDELSQMLRHANKTFEHVFSVSGLADYDREDKRQHRAMQELMYTAYIVKENASYCEQLLDCKRTVDGSSAQPFHYKDAAANLTKLTEELTRDAGVMLNLIGKGKSKGKGTSTKQ